MLDPATFFNVLWFTLGAVVGSFLNVVIVRLPAGESVVRPRSKCPRCGDMIPSWLNIPILSWLMLRGKCRACRLPISIRYPVVELLTALLFLAIGQRFGPTLATAAGLIMAGGLVAITFIDIDHWIIPDEIAIPGVIIGVLMRPFAFEVAWWDGLVGAAVGAGSLIAIRWIWWAGWKSYVAIRAKIQPGFVPEVDKSEGMGLGDVTLLAMIGAFLGPGGLLPTVLVASVAGTIVGVVLQLAARVGVVPERSSDAEGTGEAPDAPGGLKASSAREPSSTPEPSSAPEPSSLPDASASRGPEASPSAAASAEEDDEDDDWVPPPTAVPFGPFLALGALAELLFSLRAHLIGDQVVRMLLG